MNMKHAASAILTATLVFGGATKVSAAHEVQSQATIQSLLDRQIRDHPIYPKSLLGTRMQGVVTVRFTVNADGRADQIAISSKSPYAALNGAAVKMIGGMRDLPATGSHAVRASIAFKG